MPPGRSARAAFAQPTSGSTQWNAVAENTASKARSGREMSSNRSDLEGDGIGVAGASPGELDHLRAGVDRVHEEPPLDERLGQLARPAADLEHPGAFLERADCAGPVDELGGVARPDGVVGLGHGVEHLAGALRGVGIHRAAAAGPIGNIPRLMEPR